MRLVLSLTNLGFLLINKGKYDESDAVLQEADDIARSVNTNADYYRGLIFNYRSQIQFIKGDYAKTEKLAGESVQMWEPIVNKNNSDFLNVKTRLGTSLVRQGKHVEGEKVLLGILETVKNRSNNEPWRMALTHLRLGQSLMGQNRLQEAEPLILDAVEGFKNSNGENDIYTQEAFKDAAELYEKMHKPDLASRYRALLQKPPTP